MNLMPLNAYLKMGKVVNLCFVYFTTSKNNNKKISKSKKEESI